MSKNNCLINNYLENIIYHNSHFNKYEVEIDNFYTKQPNREKQINIKFGTIILFKDFPLVDIKKEENKVDFKEHYFIVIGINKNDIYLAYTTTKIDKFRNSRYKNNNYLIFSSKKQKKKFLVSIRKIFVIKKEFLIKDILNDHCLILKDLNNACKFYLKNLVLNSDLYSINFKSLINKTFKIKKKIYNYKLNIYTDIKERTDEEKKELFILFNSEYSPVKLINL